MTPANSATCPQSKGVSFIYIASGRLTELLTSAATPKTFATLRTTRPNRRHVRITLAQ